MNKSTEIGLTIATAAFIAGCGRPIPSPDHSIVYPANVDPWTQASANFNSVPREDFIDRSEGELWRVLNSDIQAADKTPVIGALQPEARTLTLLSNKKHEPLAPTAVLRALMFADNGTSFPVINVETRAASDIKPVAEALAPEFRDRAVTIITFGLPEGSDQSILDRNLTVFVNAVDSTNGYAPIPGAARKISVQSPKK